MYVLKVVALWSLLLLLRTEQVDSETCAHRLTENGELVYPGAAMSHPAPKLYTKEENMTANCILYGTVGWTRNFVINIADLPPGSALALSWVKTGYGDRVFPMYENGRYVVQGNSSRYFKIAFPKNGISFTATYNEVKVRKFLCAGLNKFVKKSTIVSCTRGRQYLSRCTIQCMERNAFDPALYNRDGSIASPELSVVCRKHESGRPVWILEDVKVDSSGTLPGLLGLFAPIVSEDGAAVPLVCSKFQCDTFPDYIDVVSCTDGASYYSNCTLQCKAGYVPAPHLYNPDGLPSEFSYVRETLPQFWTVCRRHPRLTFVSTWWPNLYDRSRIAGQPIYLSCLDLEVVRELCFSEGELTYTEPHTRNVISGCPYTLTQLIEFFNEKYSGNDTILPATDNYTTPEMPTTLPTTVILEKLQAMILNEDERNILKEIVLQWGDACQQSQGLDFVSKLVPVGEEGEPDSQKVEDIAYQLRDAFFSSQVCYASPPTLTGCDLYCIWDVEINDWVPCGKFSDPDMEKNCMSCKFGKTQGCMELRPT